MSEKIKDVYSFLIPILEHSLLLPNTTVAEIVPFMNVTLFDDALSSDKAHVGTVIWRNLDIPVLSLERVAGRQDLGEVRRSRIAIIYTLNGNEKVPYVAVMVQGIPRLVPVDENNSQMVDANPSDKGVKAWVDIDGKRAMIPDIDLLEDMMAG
ncbi:MAG: chemotaxis protein CheW [Kangiellaceae bacterium]|nr:chemotaxis protein CheW [Kangiellaceae bacterium]